MTYAWLVGFVATALGIGLGGGIAWFLIGSQKSIAAIYALCGGLIFGLICFEIAPEAIFLGDWMVFTLGVLIGIMLFKLLHTAFHKNAVKAGCQRKEAFLHTGYLLAVGIALHNLPMGVILGTMSDSLISTSILHTLILHNIPEGIILFTPLYMVGLNVGRFLSIVVGVALPVAVGVFIGSVFEVDNPMYLSFFISLTIGTILVITVEEIFTESIKQSSLLFCLIIALMGSAFIGMYFTII